MTKGGTTFERDYNGRRFAGCGLEFVDAESNLKLAELLRTLAIQLQAQTDTNATLRAWVSAATSPPDARTRWNSRNAADWSKK